MNTLKTAFLMTLLTVIVVMVGGVIGGKDGVTIAFIMAAGMNFFSYWFSDKIVLQMYKAREVTETDNPNFYGLVRRLVQRANLPMPKVYIIDSDTPNAFATGRNPQHAAVAATTGLLRILNEDELSGVMAHELAHVKNRDILIQTIAATFAGAITYLKWLAFLGGGRGSNDSRGGGLGMIFTLFLAPMAAMLVQMAISRSREFGADAGGAAICGNPLSLANALSKLEAGNKRLPMEEASPATAHMFIVNPLTGGGFAALFSTHPPMKDRIARLEEMSRTRNF